jgi:hypothetical protein
MEKFKEVHTFSIGKKRKEIGKTFSLEAYTLLEKTVVDFVRKVMTKHFPVKEMNITIEITGKKEPKDAIAE